MAEPSNIGALGNLSRGDFDKLSLGVQGQNNAKDVFGYSLTPFYDWIEIDPSQGGDGTDLGISDSGNGNNITNSTKYVDLPFLFT